MDAGLLRDSVIKQLQPKADNTPSVKRFTKQLAAPVNANLVQAMRDSQEKELAIQQRIQMARDQNQDSDSDDFADIDVPPSASQAPAKKRQLKSGGQDIWNHLTAKPRAGGRGKKLVKGPGGGSGGSGGGSGIIGGAAAAAAGDAKSTKPTNALQVSFELNHQQLGTTGPDVATKRQRRQQLPPEAATGSAGNDAQASSTDSKRRLNAASSQHPAASKPAKAARKHGVPADPRKNPRLKLVGEEDPAEEITLNVGKNPMPVADGCISGGNSPGGAIYCTESKGQTILFCDQDRRILVYRGLNGGRVSHAGRLTYTTLQPDIPHVLADQDRIWYRLSAVGGGDLCPAVSDYDDDDAQYARFEFRDTNIRHSGTPQFT